MKIRVTFAPMELAFAVQIKGEGERAAALELGARDDTFTLTVSDGDKLQGYAVFSPADDLGYFVIYAARSVARGLAAAALQGMFGAAMASGKPFRVHTERLEGMARMMGADLAQLIRDADGVPMGVFRGQ